MPATSPPISACCGASCIRAGFIVAGVGAALFCLGHAWHARRATAALGAIAELVERLLQILINTLSFARVGAFALAHAGLSSAIVALDARVGQRGHRGGRARRSAT